MARKTQASAKKSRATVLPFEIWRECFMLLSLSDHKSLAVVCRIFHDICITFIFESIIYSSVVDFSKEQSPEVPLKQVAQMSENMERFQILAKNKQHAALVWKLTLVYSLRLSVAADQALAATAKAAYGPFIDTLVKCIPAFVNLREVEIDFSRNIDKKVLAIFTNLPRLEHISFIAARFGAHQMKPRLKIQTLSIENIGYGRDCNPNSSATRLDLFSGDHLEELVVHSWVYAPKIFRSLSNQGSLQHLASLSFHLKAKDVPLLYLFLANCPNLEYLKTNINYSDDFHILDSFPPLPPSTVPSLKSLTGLASAAKAFVPGRPVTKVRLLEQAWINGVAPETDDIFQYLAMSTVPVTDLDINFMVFTPEVTALIKVDLPNLTQLRLELVHNDLFPDDPRDLELDPEVSDNPLIRISDWKASEPALQPTEFLLPRYIRTTYMTTLHWLAHKKFELPANLETLSLEESGFYLDGGQSDPDNPDGELPEQGDYPVLKRYTASAAASVFNAISIYYPTLRKVVVSPQEDDKLVWVKDTNGQWELSRMKNSGNRSVLATHLFMPVDY